MCVCITTPNVVVLRQRVQEQVGRKLLKLSSAVGPPLENVGRGRPLKYVCPHMHICKRRLLLGLSLIMGSSRLQRLFVRLPICNVFMVYLLGDYYNTCIPIGLHITRKFATKDQLMRRSPRLFHSADKWTLRKFLSVKCQYLPTEPINEGKNSRHTFNSRMTTGYKFQSHFQCQHFAVCFGTKFYRKSGN